MLLAGPGAAQTCFGRSYDDAHLDRHPDQTVQEIFFGDLTGQSILQVRLEGRQSFVYGYATCRDTGRFLSCALENAQGNFTVQERPDGTVLLRVGAMDVRLERGGTQEIILLRHDQGDDTVFKLFAGKECMN